LTALGWYCPSEGDGRWLGTRRAERAPDARYLARVARAAERAGATEILVPTGTVNDSFAGDAPFMESWTTATALAALTGSIRVIAAVNPAGLAAPLVAHQAETLERIAPGRIAINLVAGGGPAGLYGTPDLGHEARYARLAAMAATVRERFRGPFYLGGASEAAIALALERADAYLMWGEPAERIAERIAAVRARAERPLRFGLRIHVIARRTDRAAREAAADLLSHAEVAGERAREYAGFDSVGQARMNAIPADGEGWVAPGLWAGIRAVRGGAGTALVGSYGRVARMLDAYAEAGVDLVIASGYPHLEEVERVGREVWPRLAGATTARAPRRRPVAPPPSNVVPIDPRPPARAEALAERFGTPLYVFDGERIAAEAAAFRAAAGPDATVAYSVKSNTLMGLVARLHRAGCWAEVASGHEYRLARRAGVPGGRIVFNGPLKTDDELRRALAEGATVIADGLEQVRAIAALAGRASPQARVGLRLVPPDRPGTDRFGVPARAAPAVAALLARAGLPLTGLHIHLGAYQLGPMPATGPPIHGVTVQYPVPAERFAAAAAHLRATADRVGGIEWLDLGGGWPAAAALAGHLDAARAALGPGHPPLILEPGRALIRDAGWLLTRVVARRGPGRHVVDVGITQVPCVQWKRSPVHPVAPRSGPERPTDLYGPLCLQHDAIAREVPLPPLAPGDLVWIGQTGAYAMAQASPFIHLRPAAVLLEAGRATLLRARESDDEALGAQAEPLLSGPEGRVVPAP
jgi:diaminopimelate decarboxylase/alkanesulfonate monooxygenase SsuD/methylene tetrahydromethanopterin reductase-like flavin-dependent oxidoreductase (luciferase family)